jgi:DNA-binding transcriptional regulator YhcF (GntR family)
MIHFDPNNNKPKYQQLIDGIVAAIDIGELGRGQQLPSINAVASEFGMARMTVTKAYDELRERGLITSHHGKGFYVASTDTRSAMHVFILMDAMTPYKEILLDNILDNLGQEVTHSLFFHYHDIKLFETLIQDNIGKFNHFIVLPHFNMSVAKILTKIPKEKLLVLDIDVQEFSSDYSILYQNFEQNMLLGLTESLEKIKKYTCLNLVLSSKSFQYTPQGIINGFTQFCEKYDINYDIIPDLEEAYDISKNNAYIVFREFDLIKMINWCTKNGWKFGQEIGVISYDDTPLKKIIAEGISVISNDFALMGKKAAEMILSKTKGRFSNDFYFIDRNSI